ncbi:hypothetical protein AYO21_07329 [Fonsecaea monophora]|uniref:Uncharacterized protein n=1 Tax=Fonsecaea monophora TaxID=254056 RepID=A0A177F2F1_9EURO|nr:hypothetical protein AYO21_07329 [Fonsecaea monophora]KAH0847281.1 hypothetical protein FOPE_00446 [Fonsecaea pedrosoi]OAG38507.1 hypothetical protein AYO21_07329 [Fonsecaea monophora]
MESTGHKMFPVSLQSNGVVCPEDVRQLQQFHSHAGLTDLKARSDPGELEMKISPETLKVWRQLSQKTLSHLAARPLPLVAFTEPTSQPPKERHAWHNSSPPAWWTALSTLLAK